MVRGTCVVPPPLPSMPSGSALLQGTTLQGPPTAGTPVVLLGLEAALVAFLAFGASGLLFTQ